jgi:hypothetical protein
MKIGVWMHRGFAFLQCRPSPWSIAWGYLLKRSKNNRFIMTGNRIRSHNSISTIPSALQRADQSYLTVWRSWFEETQRYTPIFHCVNVSFYSLRQISLRFDSEYDHSSQYQQESGCPHRADYRRFDRSYRSHEYLRDYVRLCVDTIHR